MSSIKPIIRELREAVLAGMAHAKGKLHVLAHNLDEHLDDVIRQVKHQDVFDDKPSAPTAPHTPDLAIRHASDAGDSSPSAHLPLRDERGRFAPNPEGSGSSTYDRPSGYRAGVRDKTWDDARGPDGLVRDPETTDVLDPQEPWVMGHRPGQEFRHHQRSAEERGISREQFLAEHNDSRRYRPESPATSAGHAHELDWEDYVGP